MPLLSDDLPLWSGIQPSRYDDELTKKCFGRKRVIFRCLLFKIKLLFIQLIELFVYFIKIKPGDEFSLLQTPFLPSSFHASCSGTGGKLSFHWVVSIILLRLLICFNK